jgi:hypothetical protein
MVNFARFQNSEYFNTTGTITYGAGATLASYTYTVHTSPNAYLLAGNWIKILTSSIAELVVGTSYFINESGNPIIASLGLSATYDTSQSSTITSTLGGSATFQFLPNTGDKGGTMAKPVQGVTESYYDSTRTLQNRYYILDTEGHVWVYDTGANQWGSSLNYWVLIDTVTARSVVYGGTGGGQIATGIAVYNGWLLLFIGGTIIFKLTAMLGINPNSGGGASGWDSGPFANALNTQAGSTNPHQTYLSKSGALYWTDTSFVGFLFATANTTTGPVNPNVFSYGQITASNSGGTLAFNLVTIINGSIPYNNMPISFHSFGGTGGLPANISANIIYYIKSLTYSGSTTTFAVSATIGGASIAYGSVGTAPLYYNTLDLRIPSTYIFAPQALTIPQQEDVAQCITEIGSQLLIGCSSNTLYFWDGVALTPNGFLFLPEQNTVNMITANNMAFIFSGNRGNIYITNGNTASVVTTIPDYITGIPDPYYLWGGAMYARGRIWFSVQDQNATHTGNCGGIWSFVPTQNFFPGQDTGLALHCEHQNSYGTYNGVANVLINSSVQTAQGIQYFSAWSSDAVSPIYGIDASSTTPYTGGQTLIETDLIPIGNYLEKGNFTSILTQYDTPLVSGESVQIKYRNSITGTWNPIPDTLGGIDSVVGSLGTRFATGWAQQTLVQLQIILTSTATTPSFTRLKEIRIKK